MISISDQLNLANILTLEPRASNVIYVGANVKVETIPEYLTRVDLYSRYLGLEVLILEPSGIYNANDFINLINLGNITFKTYKFSSSLNTLEVLTSDSVVINNLESDSTTSSLSAAMGKELKRLIESRYYRHVQGVPASEWIIVHGLNRNPSVFVTDSAGTVVEGVIQYLDSNTLSINFSASFSGYAELN